MFSGSLLLAFRYEPIKDEHYIADDNVGARFNSDAIRFGLQLALSERSSVLHVHLHDHSGKPRFSHVDDREMSALIPCFVNVQPGNMHGALVLSRDAACARMWRGGFPTYVDADRITSIGSSIGVLS